MIVEPLVTDDSCLAMPRDVWATIRIHNQQFLGSRKHFTITEKGLYVLISALRATDIQGKHMVNNQLIIK